MTLDKSALRWGASILAVALLAGGTGYWAGHRQAPQSEATTPAGAGKVLYWYDPMFPNQKFDKPGKELRITQEMRQQAFDNYETTDDHGMVIMGTATDQAGNRYFKVQNSWDVRPPYDGFWYFSRPFVEYKTTSIMVNKNALPKETAKRLGLK